MSVPARILLIDSDPPDRGILRNRLRDAGHSVVEMSAWQEGLDAAKRNAWDAIIVSFRCEGVLLGKLIGQLAQDFPGRSLQAVIAYESREGSQPEDMEIALQAGVDAYLGRDEMPAIVATLHRRLEQGRNLRQMHDVHSGLLHRERVLKEAPLGALPSANPGGVEAVMLTDLGGTVLASDAGAGRLAGQSPVGRPVGQAFQKLNADRLFARASARTLVSEPFEPPSSYGSAGTPLELNVVELLSVPGEDPIKLALVTHNWGTTAAAATTMEPACRLMHRSGLETAAQWKMGLSSYLGHAPSIQALRESAREAAESVQPFLIIGARGAGARRLAKAIHCTANPLAPLNQLQAGLIPSSWILQSLAQVDGTVPHCGQRTFLISQVEQMTLEDQATLAELLDSSRVLLTSSQPPTALHPKLARAIGENFLVVPTLRERMDDLPELARHIVARMSRGAGIEDSALQALMQYPWPGNVAELESCLLSAHMAAAVHASANEPVVIHREDLPEAVLNYRFQRPGPSGVPAGTLQPWQITDADPISFDLYEKKAILRALHVCKGNRLACARMLRLGKSTLYRKLKRLGIDE